MAKKSRGVKNVNENVGRKFLSLERPPPFDPEYAQSRFLVFFRNFNFHEVGSGHPWEIKWRKWVNGF